MKRYIVSLAILSCLFIFSCKPKQAPPNPPTPVNLYTIKAVPVTYYDRYPGTTVALSEVNLVAQVQGYITGMFFKEGSHVKKGDKLYEIDVRLYQANYEAAVANLQSMKSNLVQAQQDSARYVYLNNTNAVAKQTYDHAMATASAAESQVRSAQEAVKTAQTNLSYAIITAPSDGTIGISQVKVGNMANIGQTILNTVSTDDPMAVDFLVNEKQLTYFEKIQDGSAKLVDSLFTILLPDNSLYPATGQLSIIDRAVDPQTGCIRVRLVFPNPKYYLRPGMSCIVRVHNQDTTPQMIVPGRAILEQMGEYFVFTSKDTVITDTTKGSAGQSAHKLIALQKKVKLGATIGANVIVKSGLTEGDQIVVDGIQSLHNGSAIATGTTGGGHSGKDSVAGKQHSQQGGQ